MISSYILKWNRGNEQKQATCFKLRFDEVEDNTSGLKELPEGIFSTNDLF